MKLSSMERRVIAITLVLSLIVGFMPATRRVEAAGVNYAISSEKEDKNIRGLGEPLKSTYVNENANWYQDYDYTLSNGYITLNSYEGNDTELIVPSVAEVDGVEYTVTFKNCRDYKSVWKDSGITSLKIDENVVLPRDCSNLFYGCSTLVTLDMSGIDTSNVNSMSGMFYGCSSLKYVDVSGFDMDSVGEVSDMFRGCSSLEEIDVSNFTTSDVDSFGYMFMECSSLKSIDLSRLNTSDATDMSGMFYDCKNLESITINGIDTSKVRYMNLIFANCEKLKEIDVSSFNTDSLKGVSYMFDDCYSLRSLDLSNFDLSLVTREEYMFSNCNKLEVINVPKNCNIDIELPGQFADDENNIYNALPKNLSSSIELNRQGNTDEWLDSYLYDIQDGKVILEKYHGEDTSITVPKSAVIEGVEYDVTLAAGQQSSIWEGSNAESITFEEGFVLPANCKGLFAVSGNADSEGFKAPITTIIMNGVDTSNVTDMSYMFSGCKNLTTLEWNELNTVNVTTMDHMFASCFSLSGIDLSRFNTGNVTDMSCMFKGCRGLTSINISGFDTSKVQYFGGMFIACSNLSEITLGEINTESATDMSEMFAMCPELTEIDLSCIDTSHVETIMGMFDGCTKLEQVDMSGCDLSALDSKKTYDQQGHDNVFNDCLNLQEIKTPLKLKLDIVVPEGFKDVTDYTVYTKLPTNLTTSKTIGIVKVTDSWLNDYQFEVTDGKIVLIKCIASEITRVDIPKKATYQDVEYDITFADHTTRNNKGVWSDCKKLTGIYFESGFVLPADCQSLFIINYSAPYEAALKTISMPNVDTSNVTNMAGMFKDQYRLEVLDVSGFDTSNVTDMAYMFYNCRALSSIGVSLFDMSKVTDIAYMFYYCYSLESIDMSGWDLANMTYPSAVSGSEFYSCEWLGTIKTPKNCNVDIDLPYDYTDASGNRYDKLPKNLATSIELTKAKRYSAPVWTWNGTESASARFTNVADLTDYQDVDATITYTVTATCTEAGVKTYTAKVEFNGSTYTNNKTEDIAALGHDWDEGVVTKEPTDRESGIRTFTCQRIGCGETKTETIEPNEKVYGDFEYDYDSSDNIIITSYKGSAAVVEVPAKINGIDVVSVKGAFKNNTTITDVVLPSSVTKIEYSAFQGATNLKNINLEHIKILGVRDYGSGNFAYCTSLSDIILPEEVYISGQQFCSSKMDSITIPKVMSGSKNLGSFETGEMKFAEGIERISLYFDYITVPEIIIPDSVTDISGSNFSHVNTGKIVLGSGINKISRNQFASIKDTQIIIGQNVEVLETWAFNHSKIKSLVIPDSVTEIQYHVFYDNSNLANITFSDNLTRVIGGYAGFMEGTPWFESQNDGIVYTGSALYAYKGSVPENTTISVKSGTKGIAYMALQTSDASGSNIKKVNLPNGLLYIGGASFFNTGISEINIPETVTEIEYGAFANTGLKYVYIPRSVQSIGKYAFGYECDELKDNPSVWVYDDLMSKNRADSRLMGCDVFGIDVNSWGTCHDVSKVAGFTIIGYKGTAAEQYAADNGFTFVDASKLDSPGHDYNLTKWSWTGTTSAEAKFTCKNDSSHTQSVAATITSEVTTSATCTTKGVRTYTATVTFNGKTYTATNTASIAAKEHSWGTPTWTWATDYTKATAKFTCKNDSSHTKSVVANITSEVTTPATCTTKGVRTYTATVTFNGKTYTATNTASIAVKGHSWGTPTWTWATDYTKATAKFTCKNDSSHTKSVVANITSEVTTPATCTTKGVRTYTATVTFNGKTYTAKKTASIAAKGHSWNTTPTWTWEGTSKATAKFTCKNDSSHTKSVAAKITSEVTTKPTCTTKGVRTYTATVTFNGKTYTAKKTASIAAKGHSWGTPKWTWTGTTKAVATFTCKTDSSHTKKMTGTITGKVTTKATVTTAGTKTYTATVTLNGKAYTTTKTEKIYMFDKSKTGIQKYNNALYFVKNGVQYTSFTGFAKYGNNWYYVVKGKVDTTKKDVLKGTVNGESGWWFVSGGKVQFIDSVEKNSSGWWCIQKGKVNFNFTGIAKNSLGSWYCKGGQVQFDYSGKVTFNGKTYTIKGGKVQ